MSDKKKILVVDDGKEDLESMKAILEKEGYEVIISSDGADALDKLEKGGFSLILIDIQMPTLSGYDLLRLARERINHHAKMVYVSIVLKDDVNMEDVDGFIQKPFSAETLSAEVKRILG
jgi:CheY-like chemotaxis protein